MKLAYFDCFSGISGDMVLGALIDLGLDENELNIALSSIDLEEFRLDTRTVSSFGLRATKVDVVVTESTIVRTFNNIRDLIENSDLPGVVKSKSLEIFMRIARAEAVVHNKPVDQVHFHEVGAVDSIIDIAGAAFGMHYLEIDEVFSSPLPMGHGMIKSQHGSIPVPAPAVLEILEDVPTYGRGVPTEIVTPTGAAIIKSFAAGFGPSPPMILKRTGYGGGTKELGFPNMLRVILGESIDLPASGEELAYQVSTNIDDMNPEFYEYVMKKLFEKGAHDVWLTPIHMKKTRPGTVVTVLCAPRDVSKIKDILLQETSTFGLRTSMVTKKAVEREIIGVDTRWGPVGVKVGRVSNQITNVSPEFADCARIAEEEDVPIKEVFKEAQLLAQEILNKEPGNTK
ncbi:MAG: nickel pincer cofactor biosynthesis protein LarC [Actinobacteria bacterium]|nr:nickel pincer cofactor biosynthesis protein LarC [Actinomycetota bacterium]